MIEILKAAAIETMRGTDPTAWETIGRNSYLYGSAKGFPQATEKELDLGWREGLKEIEELFPKQYKAYLKNQGAQVDADDTQWEEVKLIKGSSNGDEATLTFMIRGKKVVVEGPISSLEDPGFVVRKMQVLALQPISCPYLASDKKKFWFKEVLLVWLKSSCSVVVAHRTNSETIEELVREYITKAKDITSDENAFLQVKSAVREGDAVYIPFSGCEKFVQGRMPGVKVGKSLSNVLQDKEGLKGMIKQKGKNKQRFYRIYDEDITTPEAGGGKDNASHHGSDENTAERWDGLSDDIREEERGGYQGEDGASTKGDEGASQDPNDPFSVLSVSPEGSVDASDPLPF